MYVASRKVVSMVFCDKDIENRWVDTEGEGGGGWGRGLGDWDCHIFIHYPG